MLIIVLHFNHQVHWYWQGNQQSCKDSSSYLVARNLQQTFIDRFDLGDMEDMGNPMADGDGQLHD